MGSWGADSELIVLISPDDHLCVCEWGVGGGAGASEWGLAARLIGRT